MKISLTDTGKLKLEFTYHKFLVEAIKALADRKYDPSDHSWTIGFSTIEELNSILAVLASWNWPADQLNAIEIEAKAYYSAHGSSFTNEASQIAEFEARTKPTLNKLGQFLEQSYLDGKISQIEYGEYMRLINHLQIKDFIHK